MRYVDPSDDEQQACLKHVHVEAYCWNKLKENSASFWVILYEKFETSKNRIIHLLVITPASKEQWWQATKVGV
jgi:hypothetical protein